MREIHVSALARSKLKGQRSFPCLCWPPKPMPSTVTSQQGASPLPTEAGPPSHPPANPRVRAFLVPGVFPRLPPGNGRGGSPGRRHWAAGALAGHVVMETHRQKAAKKSEGHTGHAHGTQGVGGGALQVRPRKPDVPAAAAGARASRPHW